MHDIIGAIWENIDFLGGGEGSRGKMSSPNPWEMPPKGYFPPSNCAWNVEPFFDFYDR